MTEAEEARRRLDASSEAYWRTLAPSEADVVALTFCARCGCHYGGTCPTHGADGS